MATARTRSRKADFHPARPQIRAHSSGQARVTLSGKTHYLGRLGSVEAHEKYVDLVKRWEANGRRPLVPAVTVAQIAERAAIDAARKSVREAFAEYEAYVDATGRYQKRGKPTTERSMLKLAITELNETCGDSPIDKLTETVLLAHRDGLERRPKLTRRGINRKLQILKRALKWMRPRGIISREQWLEIHAMEPLKRGEVPSDRERRQPKRAVSREDVEAVAAEAGLVVGAMMRMQLLTSMRPGEVCAMRWQDIDKTPVKMGRAVCWTYRVPDAKTEHHGHNSQYALGPAAQRLLQPFRGAPTDYVFSPQRAMQERHNALRAARKTPPTKQMRDRDEQVRRTFKTGYSVPGYEQAVDRALSRTKVTRFTPHEIRHGFVTRAARAFGLVAAAAAANHKNVTTTQKYVHPEVDDAFRVVVGMERKNHVAERQRSKTSTA